MNVLVINLTRFGDLLQTQPLLRGLHDAGHRTGLLCLESFAGASALLDGLDYTVGLPDGAMLRALDADWRKALCGVHSMLAQMRQEFPAQLVINTTATPAARLLARLLTPPEGRCLGFDADALGQPEDAGLWAALLLGSVRRRAAGAFNITDMFRLLGGVGQGAGVNTLRRPAAAALEQAHALLAEPWQWPLPPCTEKPECGIGAEYAGKTNAAPAGCADNAQAAPADCSDMPQVKVRTPAAQTGGERGDDSCPHMACAPAAQTERDTAASCAGSSGVSAAAAGSHSASCAGFIGLQLGASAARRQWPVEFFAAVGDMLWREFRMVPVLLGVAAEQHLAAQYAAAASGPFINAVGRTDIPLLAALLTHLRVLVSNDTGTMHLAAGLGVPSLAIFLATAQPWDTGPYLADCCCLEPDMACHPCEFSTECPHGNACLRRIPPDGVCALLRARLTSGRWEDAPLMALAGMRVWRTCRDERGLLDMRAVTAHEQEPRTRWMRQQRIFLRHIVDRLEEQACPLPAAEDTPRAGLMPLDARLAESLAQACTALHAAAARGRGLLRAPTPADGQLFLEDCTRVTACLHTCPLLEPVEALWLALSRERADELPRFLAGVLALHAGLLLWRQWMAAEQAG